MSMQSLADKRLVRRLATYIVGGRMTIALLVLAISLAFIAIRSRF